jgi:hypothetical protein
LALLSRIQARLTELHDGTDEELKQQIAVLEDERDRELLEVEAARGFALERIEREYQEEKRLADKEYQVYPSRLLQYPAAPIPKFLLPFCVSVGRDFTPETYVLTSRWARKGAKTSS